MTSIFENTKSKVTVHILHDDTLTEDNRRKFIRTAEKYSQRLNLVDLSEQKKYISSEVEEFSKTRATIGAFYKLFIPEVLTGVSKVLYLDGDIIVNLDIKDLWEVDTEDCCIAGVHNVLHYAGTVKLEEVFRCWLIGCSAKTYINSGVLVMNLDKLRSGGNLFQNSMVWMKNHFHLMKWSDNDIFDGLFYKSIKLIERRFNYIGVKTEQEMEGVIIHTAGGDRTWEMTGFPYQKLYWKLYLRSAWGEDSSREYLIEVISYYSKPKAAVKRPLWKRIAGKIIRSTTIGMNVCLITKYILKDIYHKLTRR